MNCKKRERKREKEEDIRNIKRDALHLVCCPLP